MKKPLYSTAARQDLVGILQYIASDKPGAESPEVGVARAKCDLKSERGSFNLNAIASKSAALDTAVVGRRSCGLPVRCVF